MKNYHPIRIYIIIIILLLLIILPPTFRLFFPKEEKTITKNDKTITTITCTRDYPTENITETVQIRYINAKINQTKITYTNINNQSTNATTSQDELLPSAELSYLKEVSGINIEQTEQMTTVTINQDTIDNNPNNIDLVNNYFNTSKIAQQVYFTNRNFQCEETTI